MNKYIMLVLSTVILVGFSHIAIANEGSCLDKLTAPGSTEAGKRAAKIISNYKLDPVFVCSTVTTGYDDGLNENIIFLAAVAIAEDKGLISNVKWRTVLVKNNLVGYIVEFKTDGGTQNGVMGWEWKKTRYSKVSYAQSGEVRMHPAELIVSWLNAPGVNK